MDIHGARGFHLEALAQVLDGEAHGLRPAALQALRRMLGAQQVPWRVSIQTRQLTAAANNCRLRIMHGTNFRNLLLSMQHPTSLWIPITALEEQAGA